MIGLLTCALAGLAGLAVLFPRILVTGEVKNSSELAKRGASDGKESIITEAAADSSAADEIEVPFGRVAQGEARDSEYSLVESSEH